MSITARYRHRLPKAVFIIIVLLLVLLPYHAFFSVWIGTNFDIYRLAALWKEALIALIFLLVLIALPFSALRHYWTRNRLLLTLILAYLLLTFGFGLYAFITSDVHYKALAFALVINVRFLVFFVVCHLFFTYYRKQFSWLRLLIIPAIPVLLFGLAQEYFLAPRFLEYFGYSKHTILPFQYVHNEPELMRVQSFLRGANPLGAYLVLVLSALIYKVIVMEKVSLKLLAVLIISFVVLYYTYSRSAWLGVIVSCLLIVAVCLKAGKIRNKKWLLGGTCAMVLLVAIIAGAFNGNNRTLEVILLHTDPFAASVQDSNTVRATLLKEGLMTLKANPLGTGPGTAGPASLHNGDQPALISENYFVQIALEVGLQGVLLFLAINGLVAYYLWRSRADALALILFASLAGITVINMVSHAWTDDTLSLLWWGLAGLALGRVAKVDSKEVVLDAER